MTDKTDNLRPIQRYKIGYHADEWGQRSSTPSGIPDHAGSWVRYEDHVAALVEAQQPALSAALAVNPGPHAELRKTWQPGQRWQARSFRNGQWGPWTDAVAGEPFWFPHQDYRRHPDDLAPQPSPTAQADSAPAAICNACGADLLEVKQSPNSYLSAEQFDADKLGDWYCKCCPKGPSEGGSAHRYFWNRDLGAAAPQADSQRCCFGSHELQAMILAKCVEKDRADSQPALWVSPEQFANLTDSLAPFGAYLPARKTSAGKFTMPLFAARAPADSKSIDSDTLYLLRRLLSNQHTLTGPEFREELEKIVESAKTQADSKSEDTELLDFIEQHPEMSFRYRKGKWAFVGFTNYEYEMLPSLRDAVRHTLKEVKHERDK
ncbi:MAG: hypothetical protein WBI92_11740 [Cloacibacterium sp.]|uniref:hypothetical protein n=1 Tax=Cloacibacterium sp. TaxID=1913682 RepID=UPI003C778EDE